MLAGQQKLAWREGENERFGCHCAITSVFFQCQKAEIAAVNSKNGEVAAKAQKYRFQTSFDYHPHNRRPLKRSAQADIYTLN
ncbi:MAG: hypothetical protein RI973_608 [Bacteroidota bacterium]|jgi:hypothetical protein